MEYLPHWYYNFDYKMRKSGTTIVDATHPNGKSFLVRRCT